MTPREQICLRFLDDKMEATAEMVGEVLRNSGRSRRLDSLGAVGRGVLGSLRKQGLVMRLPELNAWRLTKEGREAVSQLNDEASK